MTTYTDDEWWFSIYRCFLIFVELLGLKVCGTLSVNQIFRLEWVDLCW